MKTVKRPDRSVKHLEGFQHRTVNGELLNPDTCRGRKDGRKAPDAWSASLEAIEAGETKFKEDARSTVRQTQSEADAHLSHIEELLRQNREAQMQLQKENHLLPESVARAQYALATRDLFFAILLTLVDLIAVIFIARTIFGEHILIVAPIGILLTGGIVFGIKTLLEPLSNEKKMLVKRVVIYTGVSLVLTGLVGLVILRSTTFNVGLLGESAMDAKEVSIGNLLMLLGIGLGVPLIVGVLYEAESEKLRAAKIPLELYTEKTELLKVKAEWTALTQKLQEVDNKLDDVTESVIKLRRNRYIRGYMRGVQRNPDSKQYVEIVLNWMREKKTLRTSAEVII